MDVSFECDRVSIAKDTSVNVHSWDERENYHCFGVDDSDVLSKMNSALQSGYPFVRVWYNEGIASGPRQIGEHAYSSTFKIEMDGEVVLLEPGTFGDFLCITIVIAIIIVMIKVVFD